MTCHRAGGSADCAAAAAYGELVEERPDLGDAELAAIRARADAATVGPWQSFVEGRDHLSGDNFIRTGGPDDAAPEMYVTLYYGVDPRPAPPEDLDFIAASRQDVPRLVGEIERLRRDDRGPASAPGDQPIVLLEPPGNLGVVHFAGRRYPALAVQGDTFSALRDSALHAQERLASDDVEGCAEELEDLVATLRDALAHYERVLRDRGFNVPYGNPEPAGQ